MSSDSEKPSADAKPQEKKTPPPPAKKPEEKSEDLPDRKSVV